MPEIFLVHSQNLDIFLKNVSGDKKVNDLIKEKFPMFLNKILKSACK